MSDATFVFIFIGSFIVLFPILLFVLKKIRKYNEKRLKKLVQDLRNVNSSQENTNKWCKESADLIEKILIKKWK